MDGDQALISLQPTSRRPLCNNVEKKIKLIVKKFLRKSRCCSKWPVDCSRWGWQRPSKLLLKSVMWDQDIPNYNLQPTRPVTGPRRISTSWRRPRAPPVRVEACRGTRYVSKFVLFQSMDTATSWEFWQQVREPLLQSLGGEPQRRWRAVAVARRGRARTNRETGANFILNYLVGWESGTKGLFNCRICLNVAPFIPFSRTIYMSFVFYGLVQGYYDVAIFIQITKKRMFYPDSDCQLGIEFWDFQIYVRIWVLTIQRQSHDHAKYLLPPRLPRASSLAVTFQYLFDCSVNYAY